MHRMKANMHRSTTVTLPRLGALLLLLAWGLVTPNAHAQDMLAEARNAYLDADYDRAVELFYDLAQDDGNEIPVRKEALRFLGRAYMAKDLMTEAREAIKEYVTLEPPLGKLDPDIEAPPLMDLYYEVRQEVAGSYEMEQADPGLKTVAVIDFTNGSIGPHSEEYDPLRLGLASMMINFLNGATGMEVVERERLQWLLSELDLQQSGRVDQETAVRAGKLLGAHAVLIGSFIVAGDKMYMSSRLVEVETGKILLGEQILGSPDSFFELVEKLSVQVAGAINAELESIDVGEKTETRSLRAMMAYSEGLELLESEAYEDAYYKFMQALEFDPNYNKARLKAESIKPLIG